MSATLSPATRQLEWLALSLSAILAALRAASQGRRSNGLRRLVGPPDGRTCARAQLVNQQRPLRQTLLRRDGVTPRSGFAWCAIAAKIQTQSSTDPRFEVREDSRSLAEAEVAAPSQDVWLQRFDQLLQIEPRVRRVILYGRRIISPGTASFQTPPTIRVCFNVASRRLGTSCANSLEYCCP